jgi:Dyp-type peroxidase family
MTIQSFVTICMPLQDHKQWTALRIAEVYRMLDALGNPLRSDLRARLDDCGMVHFFSFNILPWDKRDRKAYLILEAVVDGNAKSGIARIVEALGDDIFPIVQRATGLKSREKLTGFFQSHHYGLRQDLLRLGFGRIPGLGFNAKEGLTVEKIQLNAKVSDMVRAGLEDRRLYPADAGPITRFEALKTHVEATLTTSHGKPLRLTPQDADPLPFEDRRNAPWLLKTRNDPPGPLNQLSLVFLGDARFALAATFAMLLALYGYFIGFGGFGILEDAHASGAVHGVWAGTVRLLALVAAIGLAIVTSAATIVIAGAIGLWRLNWSETGDTAELGTPKVGKNGAAGSIITFNPKRNYPRDLDPDPDLVAQIMQRENHPDYVQNHMYHAVPMIAGLLRRITLMVGFRAVGHALTAIGTMRPGFLGEVGTAHAVRWFVPPGSSRIVFCGNYDGNWESYLEAFITKAPSGTNAIWSNAQGYPRTRTLFREGAEDGDRLKRYARRTMMPSRCWYSAYPKLTVEQIRRHAIIFNGLCNIGDGHASNAQAWLNLFDSVPRPDTWIEDDKIQSLMFGNQSNLPHAAILAVNFGEITTHDALAALQNWLYDKIVDGKVTFGNRRPDERARYAAFSAPGLIKLGLDNLFKPRDLGDLAARHTPRAEPSEFAPAFGMGMASEARQRLLNDPPPETWQWGYGDNEADMVLLLYWRNRAAMTRELGELCTLVTRQGYRIVKLLDLSFDDDQKGKEPFGFKDGISQPLVRGFRPDTPSEGSIHLVEPGEFILGYRDNRGYFPPTPQVAIDSTKERGAKVYLPALPDDMPQRYPDFGAQRNVRDFGRNGTYLVIRQIEQYSSDFEDYAQQASQTASPQHGQGLTPEEIKALMIGRWPDGNPLATHPVGEPASRKAGDENEFLYGSADPQGQHCPFGAHIRRGNPRDSLIPASAVELAVTNRHRILRRGRPYWNGDGSNTDAKGLLFVALNADIERQFEFIQSTWINSTAFHGLENEADPLFQPGGGKFTRPTDKGTEVFNELKQFTSLKGGGYFFLPSREALNYLAIGEARRLSTARYFKYVVS